MSLSGGKLAPRILRPNMGRRGRRRQSTAAASTVLVSDTFTDTNGTALTSHTPDTDVEGGGWSNTQVFGTEPVEIQDNEATIDNADATQSAYTHIDAGQADVDITLVETIENQNNGGTGILGRFEDANNHWRIRKEHNSGDFHLLERTGGTNTERASADAGLTGNQEYTFRAVLSGTSITGTVDGGNEINFTSSSHQSVTNHGMYIGGNDADTGGGSTATRASSFEVTAL